MKPNLAPLFVRIVGAMFVLSLLGCSGKDAPEDLAAAKKSFEERNFTAAVLHVRNALAAQPETPEARFLLGAALRRLGEFDDSRVELDKAKALGFDSTQVTDEMLALFLMERRYDKLLDLASGQSPVVPSVAARIAGFKAEALIGLGKLEEAKSVLDTALKLDAKSEAALIALARLQAIEGQADKALGTVNSVVAQFPANPDALVTKGRLLLQAGRSKEALPLFQQASAIRPGDMEARGLTVRSALINGDTKMARDEVNRLKQAYPRAPVAYHMDALVLYTLGDMPAARAAIIDSLKFQTDEPELFALAGAIHLRVGDFPSARNFLQKASSYDTKNPMTRRLMAVAYKGLGDTESAIQALKPLVEAGSSDAMALELAGDIYGARQNFPRATEYFARALALDGASAELRAKYSDALNRTGRNEEAMKVLLETPGSDKGDWAADLQVAELRFKQGDYAGSLAALVEFNSKFPDRPEGPNGKGLVLLAQKRPSDAEKSFSEALRLDRSFFPALRNLVASALVRNDSPSAEKFVQSYLDANPSEERAYELLLTLRQRNGAGPEDILAILGQAIDKLPRSKELRKRRIEALLQSGDAMTATQEAQTLRATEPDDIGVLAMLAKAEMAGGKKAQALADYARLASLMPDSPLPLLGQAEVHASEQNWTQAIALLDKAARMSPDNPVPVQSLFLVHLAQGDLAGAKKTADALKVGWPKAPYGYEAEASLALRQNDRLGAIAALQQGLDKTNDLRCASALVALYAKAGDGLAVDTQLTRWSAKNPKDSRLYVYAGDSSLAAAKLAEAERYYRKALAISPENADIINNLLWVLAESGNNEALSMGEKAIRQFPTMGVLQDTVGYIYLKRGEVERALPLLEQASRTLPKTASVRLHYAQALIKAGRRTEATQQLDAASRLKAPPAISDEIARTRQVLN
jgi:putative PEP-CTERM system TPR-repeat lipoprotein